MGAAKNILIKPISGRDARRVVTKYHYSGKTCLSSALHFGVFYRGRIEGAISYGPPLFKAGVIKMVNDTRWNDFLELNRMAFSDRLPRCSESRAIAYTIRTIKKSYKNIDWIVSFSDACQSGDGTIYRASGFYLVEIRKNTSVRVNRETGEIIQSMSAYWRGVSREFARDLVPLAGYMLRYFYPMKPGVLDRLTFPILPFSDIDDCGAGMARGKKRARKVCDGRASGTAAAKHRPPRSTKRLK